MSKYFGKLVGHKMPSMKLCGPPVDNSVGNPVNTMWIAGGKNVEMNKKIVRGMKGYGKLGGFAGNLQEICTSWRELEVFK